MSWRYAVRLVTIVCVSMFMGSLLCHAAAAECPEDPVGTEEPSSETDPIQIVVQCACIGWDAGTGTVNHHHFYANDIMKGVPLNRSYYHCLEEKRVAERLVVEAVSANLGTPNSIVSEPLYVEWVDLQCLEGNRVITCP